MSRDWSDLELQRLYDTVHDLDWYEQVEPLIARSEAAIRSKMSALRREAEIVPQHYGAKAMSSTAVVKSAAEQGSERLAGAINKLRGVA